MHTVIETPGYLRDAANAGVLDVERAAIKRFLSENPQAGDLMEGTGGARKVRFAGRGKARVADIASSPILEAMTFPSFCWLHCRKANVKTCPGWKGTS